ncbi:MAG: PTS sugar transporter subunit IIA [Coprobacillaceae bacterium]
MENKISREAIHLVDSHCDSREQFFKITSEYIGKQLNINPDSVYKGFELRESESCTAIGSGFAIPHAILKDVNDSHVFLHLVDKGIEYGAYDNEPVTVAFSLIIAEDNYNERHLREISSIARSLMNEDTQKTLKTERNIDILVKLVNEMGDNL